MKNYGGGLSSGRYITQPDRSSEKLFDGGDFAPSSTGSTIRGAGRSALRTHGRTARAMTSTKSGSGNAATAAAAKTQRSKVHAVGAQAALDLMELPMVEDRPTTRKDIVSLEYSVDSITAFAEHIRAGDQAAVASPLTQKAMEMVAECQARYAGVEIPGGVDGWSRGAVSTFAASTFEQQFIDLILGQLEAQLTVTCLEQGRLLRKLRTGYGRSFWGLTAANDDALAALRTVGEAMHSMQTALQDAEADKERALSDQRAEFDAERDTLLAQMESERALQQADLDAVEAHEERMMKTVQVLHGVFEDVRHDAEQVHNADLMQALEDQASTIGVLQQELDELRPAARQLSSAVRARAQAEKAVAAMKNEVVTLRREVEKRTLMAEELMRRESDRIAELELLAQESGSAAEKAQMLALIAQRKSEAGISDEQGGGISNAAQGGEAAPASAAEAAPAAAAVVAPVVQTSVNSRPRLKENEKIVTIGTPLPSPSRFACHSFRILLPNLMGERPKCSPEWVHRTVRGE
jgi:hypothetical protein